MDRKTIRRQYLILVTLTALGALVVSCGEDEAAGGGSKVEVVQADGDETRYGDESVVVISGGEEEADIVRGEPGDECVVISNGDCIGLEDASGTHCGEDNAQVDVIVVDGEVVDVICYPSEEDGGTLEEVAVGEDGSVTVPQNASGAVIVFDEETNGEPIEGDVRLEAERIAIYGNGVDETIIDGNLTLESNNSRARSLTVTGNVTVEKNSNNAALAFCKIHGKLTLHANGTTVANCEVYGDVKVEGNDTTLVNIGVGGKWEVGDKSLCEGCYQINDDDGDFAVGEDERGDDLECSQ